MYLLKAIAWTAFFHIFHCSLKKSDIFISIISISSLNAASFFFSFVRCIHFWESIWFRWGHFSIWNRDSCLFVIIVMLLVFQMLSAWCIMVLLTWTISYYTKWGDSTWLKSITGSSFWFTVTSLLFRYASLHRPAHFPFKKKKHTHRIFLMRTQNHCIQIQNRPFSDIESTLIAYVFFYRETFNFLILRFIILFRKLDMGANKIRIFLSIFHFAISVRQERKCLETILLFFFLLLADFELVNGKIRKRKRKFTKR